MKDELRSMLVEIRKSLAAMDLETKELIEKGKNQKATDHDIFMFFVEMSASQHRYELLYKNAAAAFNQENKRSQQTNLAIPGRN